MRQKGFTLIELLVVIAIMGILTMLTIAGYDNYRKVQILQTASNEVATMLNLARSRAQSQIKPPAPICADALPNLNKLYGYKVVIDSVSSPNKYTLYVSCSAASPPIDPTTAAITSADQPITQQVKQLPKGVTFSNDRYFFFPIQTGGAYYPPGVGNNIITVNYGGKQKTITVDPTLGGVSIQ